jgi:hypothetical protein
MRWALIASALIGALSLYGCGRGEAHDYPAGLQAEFHHNCPASDPVCVCTWDEITHAVTAEEYQAAMDRFRREGRMEPKITHARTVCRERNLSS